MDRRRRKKLQSHTRGLALVNEHRAYLTSTAGGADAVASLDQHLADEAAAATDQEANASEARSASAQLRTLRSALHEGVKHIAAVSAVVMPVAGKGAPFDPTHPPNDDQLVARIDFLHGAVSANQDAFAKKGIQPGMLDTLAAQLAAFKKAKAALTSRQYAEASDRFDQAFELADKDFAIIEGILATSSDAPAGALEALRATTRIGPRIPPDAPTTGTPGQGTQGTQGTTTTTTAPAPPTPVTPADTTHTPFDSAQGGPAGTTTPADPQKAA